MITCANGAKQNCLGYIMYEDMGNKPYVMPLESCIKDDGAVWLKEGKKGDLTECIFALGYVYQTKSNQALEGIMDL
eukprot:13978629-Heterocapsa_arctica.AAC.1